MVSLGYSDTRSHLAEEKHTAGVSIFPGSSASVRAKFCASAYTRPESHFACISAALESTASGLNVSSGALPFALWGASGEWSWKVVGEDV
jgi:hypothetical protein